MHFSSRVGLIFLDPICTSSSWDCFTLKKPPHSHRAFQLGGANWLLLPRASNEHSDNKVMSFCLCLLAAALIYMMVAVASPALHVSSFHIPQLWDQANFPNVGTPCRDRAWAAHRVRPSPFLHLMLQFFYLFYFTTLGNCLKPTQFSVIFSSVQCNVMGSAHDRFSTRPVALNVIVEQSCCCSAIT